LERTRSESLCPKTCSVTSKVGLGDEVWITEVPCGVEVSGNSPQNTEKMKVTGQVMDENREVLKRLADS
jgi:hypothetical protein